MNKEIERLVSSMLMAGLIEVMKNHMDAVEKKAPETAKKIQEIIICDESLSEITKYIEDRVAELRVELGINEIEDRVAELRVELGINE